MKVRNTFIIFIVSGFWHGANWTYVIWGVLNAIYFLPLMLTKNNRNNLDIVAKGKYLPSFKEFSSILLTFGLTVFAWIFFRADSIEHAMKYIFDIFKHPGSFLLLSVYMKYTTIIVLIGVFIVFEWLGKENQYATQQVTLKWKWPFKYSFYFAIIIVIFWFGGEEQEFIYFQF
jgi:alginate O-acetyltransferase complex protein AlgI